MFRLGVSI